MIKFAFDHLYHYCIKTNILQHHHSGYAMFCFVLFFLFDLFFMGQINMVIGYGGRSPCGSAYFVSPDAFFLQTCFWKAQEMILSIRGLHLQMVSAATFPRMSLRKFDKSGNWNRCSARHIIIQRKGFEYHHEVTASSSIFTIFAGRGLKMFSSAFLEMFFGTESEFLRMQKWH